MAKKCPKCQSENPETAAFYADCGTQLLSIEHYEKFLDLWKDADPGLFEVEDAKKRLNELSDRSGSYSIEIQEGYG